MSSATEDKTALVGYYLNEGIRLVKLRASDKQPFEDAWQDPDKVKHSQEEFEKHVQGGGGLGWQLGEVSGWLSVVDCDWEIARKLASRFLPDTLRATKGNEEPSHYVYYSEGLGYEQFKGLDGSVIIDVKASNNGRGHQVAVAPTGHPEKGPYQFVGGYNPAAVSTAAAAELRRKIRLLVCASLVAANLPASKKEGVGGRHDLALAYIGYLLRNGVSAEDIEKVLTAAWEVRGAPREAVEDVRRSIPDSAKRLAKDEPVKGGRSLGDTVHGMADRIAKVFGWGKADKRDGRKSYMRTDLGNAERFVDTCGEDVRWCTEAVRWMIWDGTRWEFDEGAHAAHRLAHRSVRSIFSEAENAPDDQEAKAISAHAVASQSASRIEALLSQARPYLNISMDDLDRDTWLVNCTNGKLDVRTGELREHRRGDLITKCVPFDYDPDTQAPRFLEFMEQVLPDPEVRAFVQRYAGYSLTGSTRERVLAFLHGNGKNGKSTLVEALREAAGEYARNTTVETILSSRSGSQIPNDVAALKGARLVSAAEPEKNRRMAESKVKNLTGSDTVTARFMRGEFFDFKPEFKLWISMNHKPVIVGTDDAIWDRIRLVPFEQRFADNPDTELPAKLAGEREGIFAWMVRGALDWYQHGLGCPDAVAAATEGYREEMDTLGDFFKARCVLDPDATAPATALYKQYEMWCDDAGESKASQESQRAFGMRLSERGFDSGRYTAGVNKGQRFWRGIGIKHSDPGPEDGPNGSPSEGKATNHSPYESPIPEPYSPAKHTNGEGSEQGITVNSSKYIREAVNAKSGSLPSLPSLEGQNELWQERQKDIDRALDDTDNPPYEELI